MAVEIIEECWDQPTVQSAGTSHLLLECWGQPSVGSAGSWDQPIVPPTLRGFGTDVIDVVEARIIVLIDSSAGRYSDVSFS